MAVDGSVTIKAILDASGVVSGVKVINSSVDGIKTDGITNVGTKADAAGSKATGMGKSILGAGALAGAASAVTTAAIGAISGSLDDAISRVDTMNNFPTVMKNLGYSAGDADKSINQMSDHLTGLPTALNDMTSFVQKLSASTGDLQTATDVGLGFNDMMLSGGGSTEVVSAAMEQYNQMLAKGTVDQEAWNSVVTAAPGQMKQLAQSMLGPKANAQTLYSALQTGKVKMSDMNEAIVKLDKQGGKGFSSFSKQAKSATGGIGTSLANVKTAVTRSLANIIDAIGQKNISNVIKKISSAISGFGTFVKDHGSTIKSVFKAITSFMTDTVMPIAGQIYGAVAPVVMNIVKMIIDKIPAIETVVGAVMGAVKNVIETVWPFVAGIIDGAVQVIGGVIQLLADIINGNFSGIQQDIGAILDGLVQIVENAFGYIVSYIGLILSPIANFVGGIFSGIAGFASSVFWGMVDNIKGIFDAAYKAITDPIGTARDFIKGAIDAIVGFFGFKISWPHIPVPYFSIKPDGWQIGDLLKGSIPSLAIDWYATGGIFNGPSIIGVGERGREMVLPVDNPTYMNPVAKAIAANLSGTGGNTYVYNIDGVQYQQGSDGAQAVTDLVSALKLNVRRQ